jgi:hypothetical protein
VPRGIAVNDVGRVASYRRFMVGRGGTRRKTMNEKATRMLFAAAALSAFAAVLASSANARQPEGAVVPAEIYSASTSPVTTQEQTPETSGTFFVPAEIYSASTTPPTVLIKQQAQQTNVALDPAIKSAVAAATAKQRRAKHQATTTSVDVRLGEIGAWFPLVSHQKPQRGQQKFPPGYRGLP